LLIILGFEKERQIRTKIIFQTDNDKEWRE